LAVEEEQEKLPSISAECNSVEDILSADTAVE